MRPPYESRHRHGGVRRPRILGCLFRGKQKNRPSRTDHQKIHKYLPSLEGGWPNRQGAPRDIGIPGLIRIEKAFAKDPKEGFFLYG